MTAFTVMSPQDLQRRLHELDVETRHDKARFAAWVISIFLVIGASLAHGLASWHW
jgi:hypothetical protein